MKTVNPRYLLALPLLLGALTLGACGGGSDGDAGADTGPDPARTGGGGMFANLDDEDVACLKDKGVTLPERPEGAPDGQPPGGVPEGGPPDGERPEGMPEGGPDGGRPGGMPEGMEDLRSAMTECGIELPDPPEGGPAGGESGT